MSTITAIREALGWTSKVADYSFQRFDGYEVETNEGAIRIGISTEQSCCETTGYFWSDDDFSSFIGAELSDVEVVDTELNVKKHVEVEDGGTMFVNFTTNRGVLQFVVYNSHNGYYGHHAIVESEKLVYEETL